MCVEFAEIILYGKKWIFIFLSNRSKQSSLWLEGDIFRGRNKNQNLNKKCEFGIYSAAYREHVANLRNTRNKNNCNNQNQKQQVSEKEALFYCKLALGIQYL